MNQQIDTANPCGYCQATHSVQLYPTCSISGDDYYANRCLECRAVFLSPRPTQHQLNQAYSDSYYGEGHAKFAGYIEKILNFSCSVRARTVYNYIKPPARILDIGCGNGGFLSCMINRGFDGHGIELPGKASQRAAKVPNLKLKVGQLSDADFPENYFDGITMWHVFEHLTEPEKTMQIIRKILKPGGHLMIALPNIDSIQSGLFRGKWLHLDPPAHLFFMAPPDLVPAMRQFGMKFIKQSYFSLTQNSFGIQQSILNCLLAKREVLFEALKGNNTYVKEYSRFNIFLQEILWLSTFPLFALIACLESALQRGGTVKLIFRKEDS